MPVTAPTSAAYQAKRRAPASKGLRVGLFDSLSDADFSATVSVQDSLHPGQIAHQSNVIGLQLPIKNINSASIAGRLAAHALQIELGATDGGSPMIHTRTDTVFPPTCAILTQRITNSTTMGPAQVVQKWILRNSPGALSASLKNLSAAWRGVWVVDASKITDDNGGNGVRWKILVRRNGVTDEEFVVDLRNLSIVSSGPGSGPTIIDGGAGNAGRVGVAFDILGSAGDDIEISIITGNQQWANSPLEHAMVLYDNTPGVNGSVELCVSQPGGNYREHAANSDGELPGQASGRYLPQAWVDQVKAIFAAEGLAVEFVSGYCGVNGSNGASAAYVTSAVDKWATAGVTALHLNAPHAVGGADGSDVDAVVSNYQTVQAAGTADVDASLVEISSTYDLMGRRDIVQYGVDEGVQWDVTSPVDDDTHVTFQFVEAIAPMIETFLESAIASGSALADPANKYLPAQRGSGTPRDFGQTFGGDPLPVRGTGRPRPQVDH